MLYKTPNINNRYNVWSHQKEEHENMHDFDTFQAVINSTLEWRETMHEDTMIA